MIQEKKWYRTVMKVSGLCNKMINLICVLLLTLQAVTILIMVAGRSIFNYVPAWSEQGALFCMIWFSILSISLAVRTDSHVKMEAVDNLVSPGTLRYFKLFGSICCIAFGVILVYYGMKLTILTWPNKLSALRIPMGAQYFSAVAGGGFIILNAIIYSIEMLAQYEYEQKEGGKTA